jgi:hypothetical protein
MGGIHPQVAASAFRFPSRKNLMRPMKELEFVTGALRAVSSKCNIAAQNAGA